MSLPLRSGIFAFIGSVFYFSLPFKAGAQISLPPSQHWDGNYGPWSSFAVQIGTPPQVIRVLMSSSGSSLWVPLPEGCIDTDPINCPDQRGGLFHYNSSSTWNETGRYALPLEAESSLGYSGNSLVGLDNVTLGWMQSGTTSINTVVTGFATEDFFFGLPRTYFPTYQYLLIQDAVSKSTRQPIAYGSLTIGGYDATRSNLASGLVVKMGSKKNRDLLLAITNISSNRTSLLNTTIYAFIDSTVPHIWLLHDRFEEAFGLILDSETDLYLINDTQHNRLLSSNPSVTISLAAGASTKDPVEASSDSNVIDIVMPYGAFDIEVTHPLASSTDINATSRYFPLRKALNSTQHTLGRAFLQEAYLHVDYDAGNIIPVYPETATKNQENEPSQPNQKRENRMIAGITTGVILPAVGLIAAAFYYRRLRRRRGMTLASRRNLCGQNGVTNNDLKEDKAELAADAGGEGDWHVRAKHFLDGQEIRHTGRYTASATSATRAMLVAELCTGATIPAWELADEGNTPMSELDAINRNIFALPVEVAEEMP